VDGTEALAAAFDAAPVGIAVFDGSDRFVYVNPVLAAINGVPVAEHLGRHPYELFGPDVTAGWVPLVERCRTSGQLVGPLRLPPTGDGRRYETYYYPTDLGEDRGSVAVVRDVTNQHVAEQRARLLSDLARTLTAAPSRDEVAAAVSAFLHEAFGARAVIALRDPGSEDLVIHPSMAGYDDDARATWARRRIPLSEPTGFAAVATDLQRHAVRSIDELLERFPSRFAEELRRTGDESCVWVPVAHPVERDRALAVLRLAWPTVRGLDASEDAALETAASLAGLALHRTELTEASARDIFRRALDAMLDNVAIGSAVRDDRGRVVDFVIEYANDGSRDGTGRGAADRIGRTMTELYPGWAQSPMFQRYVDAVETGAGFVVDRLRYRDIVTGDHGDSWWRVQVARLGDGFIGASRDITREIEREEELAQARVRDEAEREAVRLLQEIALPQVLGEIPGVQLAAHYQSADVDVPIGGDWYDVIVLDRHRVVLSIGDVAGHGKAAAAAMVRLRGTVAAFVQAGESPGGALTRTAGVIGTEGGTFATCCCVLVDLEQGTLTSSSAGHPPVIVADATGTHLLAAPQGPPIGVDGAAYSDVTTRVDGRTTLLLYTDGLVERRRVDLAASIDALRLRVGAVSDRSAQAACGEIVAAAGTSGLEDDFCLVLATVDPAARSGERVA